MESKDINAILTANKYLTILKLEKKETSFIKKFLKRKIESALHQTKYSNILFPRNVIFLLFLFVR